MTWIKKHLFFVIGLALSGCLLAVSAAHLFQALDAKTVAQEDLENKNRQLSELVARDPYPNKENIALAKLEQARVSKFIADARSRFGSVEASVTLDNAAFKSLLESTISSLEQDAQTFGVKLPGDKFGFTFGEQRKQLQLPNNSLGAFARQLGDIQGICNVLFNARVHALIAIKRTGVGTNESFGNTDILNKKSATNLVAKASIYPYEITFQCLSAELGEVLAGFVKAPKSYVLKTINVERGEIDTASSPAFANITAAPGGLDAALASRYGLGRYGNRYAPQPVQAPVQASVSKPNEPILDEKPLRVTVGLEIVKLAD